MIKSLTTNESKVIGFLSDKFFNGNFDKALHAVLYEGTLAYILTLKGDNKKEYNDLISQQVLLGGDEK